MAKANSKIDKKLVSLPDFLKRHFWDVDFSSLKKRASAKYIIERILENGDLEAARWLLNNYRRGEIADVITETRGLSPKNATFWAILFGVSRKRIKCLSKSYMEIRSQFWNY